MSIKIKKLPVDKIVFYGLQIDEEAGISKNNEKITLGFSTRFKLFDTEKERKIFINQNLGKKIISFDITEEAMKTFGFATKEQVYDSLKKSYKKTIEQQNKLLKKQFGGFI